MYTRHMPLPSLARVTSYNASSEAISVVPDTGSRTRASVGRLGRTVVSSKDFKATLCCNSGGACGHGVADKAVYRVGAGREIVITRQCSTQLAVGVVWVAWARFVRLHGQRVCGEQSKGTNPTGSCEVGMWVEGYVDILGMRVQKWWHDAPKYPTQACSTR